MQNDKVPTWISDHPDSQDATKLPPLPDPLNLQPIVRSQFINNVPIDVTEQVTSLRDLQKHLPPNYWPLDEEEERYMAEWKEIIEKEIVEEQIARRHRDSYYHDPEMHGPEDDEFLRRNLTLPPRDPMSLTIRPQNYARGLRTRNTQDKR